MVLWPERAAHFEKRIDGSGEIQFLLQAVTGEGTVVNGFESGRCFARCVHKGSRAHDADESVVRCGSRREWWGCRGKEDRELDMLS